MKIFKLESIKLVKVSDFLLLSILSFLSQVIIMIEHSFRNNILEVINRL